MYKLKLVFLVLFLTTNCSLAPKLEKAEIATAKHWHSDIFFDDGNIQRNWWQNFNDPNLVNIINEALQNNSDINLASERVVEARALLSNKKAELYPRLDFQGSATRSEASEKTVGDNTKPANDFQASGIFSYELDLWGRLSNASKSAKARLFASKANQETIKLAVLSETTNAYFNLMALNKQIEIANQTITSREKSLFLQKQRFEIGEIDELSLKQAEAELLTVKVDLPSLLEQQSLLQNALAIMLGRTPKQIVESKITTETSIDDINIPQNIPLGNPADFITRRPDVFALEQELIASNADIGVVRAAFLPTLSFKGLLGLQSPNIDSLFSKDASTWLGGGNIAGNLLDFNRISSLVEQAESRKKQTYINYNQTIRIAFKEVLDSLESFRRSTERLNLQKELLDTQKETVLLANKLFTNGLSNYLDVLDAERRLFLTELSYVKNQQNKLQSIVSLYRALGGGWLADDVN